MELKNKTEEEILFYITTKLNGRKFDMSGYDCCCYNNTTFNQKILNIFADLGIYDYTHYLYLDFYKGNGTLYLKFWNDNEDLSYDLGGEGTIDIIQFIFNLTILSDKTKRRR